MTEIRNIDTILENGDEALSGMPYLYRSKGLPSLVYDAASGTMKSFDPSKNMLENMQKLAENTPSLFVF